MGHWRSSAPRASWTSKYLSVHQCQCQCHVPYSIQCQPCQHHSGACTSACANRCTCSHTTHQRQRQQHQHQRQHQRQHQHHSACARTCTGTCTITSSTVPGAGSSTGSSTCTSCCTRASTTSGSTSSTSGSADDGEGRSRRTGRTPDQRWGGWPRMRRRRKRSKTRTSTSESRGQQQRQNRVTAQAPRIGQCAVYSHPTGWSTGAARDCRKINPRKAPEAPLFSERFPKQANLISDSGQRIIGNLDYWRKYATPQPPVLPISGSYRPNQPASTS